MKIWENGSKMKNENFIDKRPSVLGIRLLIPMLTSMLFSCATPSTAPQDSDEGIQAEESSGKSISVVFPMSNDIRIGKVIHKNDGLEHAKDLKDSITKNGGDLETINEWVMTRAFVDKEFDNVLESASKLAAAVAKTGADKKIDEKTKLLMSISAIKSGRWGYFYLWTDELLTSKSKKIRALTLNLRGVVAYQAHRIPEAMELWKSALELDPKCQACALNTSLIYLKSGFFEDASQTLPKLGKDWLEQAISISIKKGLKKSEQVKTLCDQVLDDQPHHAPTLYNCAIFDFENGVTDKVKNNLEKALKAPILDGDDIWRSDARKIIENLE